MNTFFRKERPEIFLERFSEPTLPTNAWSLKSHTIFKAKSAQKKFTVNLKGKYIQINCVVEGTNLKLTYIDGSQKTALIQEKEIGALLKIKKESDDIKSLAVKNLCQTHATSSKSSPLISGCVENNFKASKGYEGYKLCLELKIREPFANPFVSGNEKEYFLVGKVEDLDCKLIKYLGKDSKNGSEEKNKIVNFFGSKIVHPSENTSGEKIEIVDPSNSKLPPPSVVKKPNF